MDDGEGHRKQHALPGYSGIPPLGAVTEAGQRQSGRAGIEGSRLGAMPGAHVSTSAPPIQGAPAYGLYDDGSHTSSLPVPQHQLQYPSDDSHYHTRQPSIPQYGSGMVYGAVQQMGQNAAPPYDPVLHYQHARRPAGIEALPTQFVGVPPFYVPSEPITTSAAAVPTQHAPAPSAFPSLGFPQTSPAARPPLAPVYSPPMTDLPQGTTPQQPAAAAASEFGQGPPNYEAAYGWYQTSLKRTFEQVHAAQLAEAGQTLLEISDWLLTHAAELGLTRDEQELHGDRLRLWREFNVCWLSALQKQKEMTEAMLRSGQRPAPPQTILAEDFLERMGSQLIRLCDGMEQHGLVDYEMGVWEEEIINVLEDCLDLLKTGTETSSQQPGGPAQLPTGSQASAAVSLGNAP